MLEMTFEQALKNALFADLEKEYGHFMNSDFELPPHSKKYLRFEKKILRDPMGYIHQSKKPVWKTVLQKAALIIIAITVFIGFNFIAEFLVNVLCCPIIVRLLHVLKKS